MSHKYYAYQKSERFHTEDWKLSGSTLVWFRNGFSKRGGHHFAHESRVGAAGLDFTWCIFPPPLQALADTLQLLPAFF